MGLPHPDQPQANQLSHHMLRRTARAKCHRLEQQDRTHRYRVIKALHGPWRYRVVQLPLGEYKTSVEPGDFRSALDG